MMSVHAHAVVEVIEMLLFVLVMYLDALAVAME
jgi:hypothetical protein